MARFPVDVDAGRLRQCYHAAGPTQQAVEPRHIDLQQVIIIEAIILYRIENDE